MKLGIQNRYVTLRSYNCLIWYCLTVFSCYSGSVLPPPRQREVVGPHQERWFCFFSSASEGGGGVACLCHLTHHRIPPSSLSLSLWAPDSWLTTLDRSVFSTASCPWCLHALVSSVILTTLWSWRLYVLDSSLVSDSSPTFYAANITWSFRPFDSSLFVVVILHLDSFPSLIDHSSWQCPSLDSLSFWQNPVGFLDVLSTLDSLNSWESIL